MENVTIEKVLQKVTKTAKIKSNKQKERVMETIGARIIRLRKIHRLTQSQLAEKLNVSDKVISNWECGETTPGLNDITTLKNYFNVSLDFLVDGKETREDAQSLIPQITDAELKSDWIKKCLKFINDAKLKKYTDIIFPKCERDALMSDSISYDWTSNLGVGIFALGILQEDEYGIYEGDITINLNRLLQLDNFQIYDAIIKQHLQIVEICKNVSNKPLRERDFYDKKPICAEDIQGLTDVHFYELLNDKKELQSAFESLDKQNPNKWHIIKVLIEKGASIRRLVSIDPTYGNSYYADDWLVTELVYNLALTKLNTK